MRQLLRGGMAAALPRRLFMTQGPPGDRSVRLTFDDGPHPEYTPRLLDVLGEYGVAATFFVIGREAERYPQLIHRMMEEGHEIGNHSHTHCKPEETSVRQFIDEVIRTDKVLTQVAGRRPRLFRPPFGKLTAAKLWCLWWAGKTVVLWNIDPKDFSCQSAEEIRSYFRARPPQSGDLILMHDTNPRTIEAVPDVIMLVRRHGLALVTVSS